MDKYLWCVRLFKTRTEAAKACIENKVIMHDGAVKPGREIKVDDIFTVKKGSLRYTYTTMDIPKS
ncbi:MAG TPA: RNA-binding S4 domain-containing protein, partial [Flavobacteriales bacterium]|nr:RNA-binding S4 domain-containing protein [Flavobacteriales bacterium]